MPALITPDRFVKASEVSDLWGPNILLYGEPGTGKTTLAAGAQDSPHGKNVFVIDIEGGTRSIADRKDVTVFKPADWSELSQVYTFLANEKHEFRTIIIDSLTEAQRLGLDSIMRTAKNPDLPGLQDFGRSNEQLTRMVRAYRGLSQSRGFTVIFTALEKQDKDESTGAMHVGPTLTPKAAEGVCGAVDAVLRLVIRRDGTRVLQIAPRGNIVCKYRMPLTGARLPDEMEQPSMVKILETLRGHA